eukprot:PITA_15242
MGNFDKYNCFYFANYCKQATILFHLIALLFMSNFTSVLSDSRQLVTCNNATRSSNGSAFSSNWNRVMEDLVKNTPQTGYNTSGYGQNPNRVDGLLQCTGNISQQACSICSQQASDSVLQLCGNCIGGRVSMDNCYLRYENYSFYNQLNTTLYKLWVNSSNISSGDIYSFTNTTSKLLLNLSDEAINSANKAFAQGSATYSVNGTVYGLVQCWRDLSLENCESCLRSATLVLASSMSQGAQALLGSCTVRYEIYPFFDDRTGGSSASANPPPVGAPNTSPPASPISGANPLANGTSPTMSNGSSSKTLPIILGGVVLVLMACLFAKWMKMRLSRRGTCLQNEETHESDPESTQLKQTQIVFTLEALAEATNNFAENKKLGEGGFGPVYKGITRDGIEIAVKKLSVRSRQGKREFMNEVNLVANVQHRNLVKLLGCCAEGQERLLVYEYLPNKSLDTFLFDPEKKRHLDWQKRYNIIIGIARGLLYLHEDSQLRIIHRDIKPNNILLDEGLNPKIADFGLARLFPEDETHIQTKAAGTFGYIAPEYAMQGRLSEKVDVYSFGVQVLEIVSGRKNTDLNFPDEMQTLLEWAWRLYKRGCLPDMIDSTLAETMRQEQALRCIQVALLCTQADAGLRPSMCNVILMISSATATLANPTKPAFVKTSDSTYERSTDGSSSSGIQLSWSSASTENHLVPSINHVTI